MPHDIDGGGNANLKSALKRRSKYDEELSIGEEEHQVEESVSDESDVEADHEEIELIEEHENNGDFVDWDDINDPEYIAVNPFNAYSEDDVVDGGKGDLKY